MMYDVLEGFPNTMAKLMTKANKKPLPKTPKKRVLIVVLSLAGIGDAYGKSMYAAHTRQPFR